MNGRAEASATYVLTRLVVLPLYWNRMEAIEHLLITLMLGGRKHWVRKEARYKPPSHCWGVGRLPYLASGRHASKLAFLRHVLTEESILESSVRDTFPSLTITTPMESSEINVIRIRI